MSSVWHSLRQVEYAAASVRGLAARIYVNREVRCDRHASGGRFSEPRQSATSIKEPADAWNQAYAKDFLVACLCLAASATGQACISDLPSIDGWMRREDGSPANWLGRKYGGRQLDEPINVVLVDFFSKSREEAVANVLAACKKAGYEEEFGHSSGYAAFLDGRLYPQIPNERRMAFANRDFLMTNNHGRIMGPCEYRGAYVFAGSFSRERLSASHGLSHAFVSFTAAREDFALKMREAGVFGVERRLRLGNTLNDSLSTTADHDGFAVVLVATK